MPHFKRTRAKYARAGCTCGNKRFKQNCAKGTAEARTRQEVWADDSHSDPHYRRCSKSKGKKLWVIEQRNKPGGKVWCGPGQKWVAYGRYARKRDRDEALRCLQLRERNGGEYYLWRDIEYRPKDPQ